MSKGPTLKSRNTFPNQPTDNRKKKLMKIILAFNVAFLIYNLIVLVKNLRDPEIVEQGNSYEDRKKSLYKSLANEKRGRQYLNRSDYFLVPNVVHYIWYAEEPKPLQFHHMVAIYSVYKIIKPRVIFFHTNLPPNGEYWKAVLKLDNFVVNMRQPPMTLFGEPVKAPMYYTSHSNVDRVKILTEVGGIYLDLDVIVTRPFDDLRRYPCVIGKEEYDHACGSVIICSKYSPFLLIWLNSFLDDYQIDVWAYNSGKVPFNLAHRFPHLVHLDEDKLNRPNFDELEFIWGPKRFNWSNNYAVHTWYRLWKDLSPFYEGIEPNEENIKSWNSTYGEMTRSILFGSPKLIDVD